MRIAVIGAGIFGCTTALELARDPRNNVTLYDKNPDILQGATGHNHNRHHLGYHYPRSLETARQCVESSLEFKQRYGACLDANFRNFYGIAREGSKTTPEQFLEFCRQAGGLWALPCPSKEHPLSGAENIAKLAAVFQVDEGVYNQNILRELVRRELNRSLAIHDLHAVGPCGHPVELVMGRQARIGNIDSHGFKQVLLGSGERNDLCESGLFDIVINCAYANTNTIFPHVPPRPLQFNLQELAVVQIPNVPRFGITIQDGEFPCIIPVAHTQDRYLVAHVTASQLVREVSSAGPLLSRVNAVESNWEGILEASIDYLPILKRARYCKSIFVDRVVDMSPTDARLTEVVDHGHGCWSVFGSKVVTALSTARKVADMVTMRAVVS